MTSVNSLRCDGCGRAASPEHVARRLRRLEWTTRYRPVHIGALLLGAFPPVDDAEFLYCGNNPFAGEAEHVLNALDVPHADKQVEVVLADFQRRGFLLAHVLECPIESNTENAAIIADLLAKQLPAVFARIRRSLKPKMVVLLSEALEPFANHFAQQGLGCPLVLDAGKPFVLDKRDSGQASMRLRGALAQTASAAR